MHHKPLCDLRHLHLRVFTITYWFPGRCRQWTMGCVALDVSVGAGVDAGLAAPRACAARARPQHLLPHTRYAGKSRASSGVSSRCVLLYALPG